MSRPPSRVPSYARPTAASKARADADQPKSTAEHRSGPRSSPSQAVVKKPLVPRPQANATRPPSTRLVTQARPKEGSVVVRPTVAKQKSRDTGRVRKGGEVEEVKTQPNQRNPGLLLSSPAHQEILLRVLWIVQRRDIFAIQKVCRNAAWTIRENSDIQIRITRHVHRCRTPAASDTSLTPQQWREKFQEWSDRSFNCVTGTSHVLNLATDFEWYFPPPLQAIIAIGTQPNRGAHTNGWLVLRCREPGQLTRIMARHVASAAFDRLVICPPDNAVLTVSIPSGSSLVAADVRTYLLNDTWSPTLDARIHPDARFARLTVRGHTECAYASTSQLVDVQCAKGGTAALLFGSGSTESYVWSLLHVVNWKTGESIGAYDTYRLFTKYTSCLFLDERKVLCGGVRVKPTERLHEPRAVEPNRTKLEIFDILDYSSTRRAAVKKVDGATGHAEFGATCSKLSPFASFIFPPVSRRLRDGYIALCERGQARSLLFRNWPHCAVTSLSVHGADTDEGRVITFRLEGEGITGVVLLSGLLDLVNRRTTRCSRGAPSNPARPRSVPRSTPSTSQLETDPCDTFLGPIYQWTDWRRLVSLEHDGPISPGSHCSYGSQVCVFVPGETTWRIEIREYNSRLHSHLINRDHDPWTLPDSPEDRQHRRNSTRGD